MLITPMPRLGKALFGNGFGFARLGLDRAHEPLATHIGRAGRGLGRARLPPGSPTDGHRASHGYPGCAETD